MVAFRRILVAGIATLLLAGACTSITLPSFPPINLPSIPPINLPSIPPINLPSIPPINIPGVSIPPIGLPGGGTTTTPCQLVTAAEIGQIFGSQVSDESGSPTDCSFQLALSSVVTVQTTSDTDFSGLQFLLGNTAQNLTVAGFPAVSGTFIGQALLYVQKPSGQLQLLGILTGSDPATFAKLQQVATIALGRMP